MEIKNQAIGHVLIVATMSLPRGMLVGNAAQLGVVEAEVEVKVSVEAEVVRNLAIGLARIVEITCLPLGMLAGNVAQPRVAVRGVVARLEARLVEKLANGVSRENVGAMGAAKANPRLSEPVH